MECDNVCVFLVLFSLCFCFFFSAVFYDDEDDDDHCDDQLNCDGQTNYILLQ